MHKSLSIIVAMDKNGLIGLDGGIPWMGKMADDMKHFRDTTMGKTIVMGRKTYESIGKPLDGRNNIVLTRHDTITFESCFMARSADVVLRLYRDEYIKNLFVIGGAQIYDEFMPYANRLYITRIHEEFEGDTYFPEFDIKEWDLISCYKGVQNSRNVYPHEFQTWARKD